MRARLLWGVILILIVSCSSTKKMVRSVLLNDITKTDSTEYEIIVFDSGFDTWYLAHSYPLTYHSQWYYESWNQQYVNAWNYYYNSSKRHDLLDGPINYEPNVDYGLEVNHKLFYYFQFVQHVRKTPLLTNAPRLGR